MLASFPLKTCSFVIQESTMNDCQKAFVDIIKTRPGHIMLWEDIKGHLIASGFTHDEAIEASIFLEDKNIITEMDLFVHSSGALETFFKLNIEELMGKAFFDLIETDDDL